MCLPLSSCLLLSTDPLSNLLSHGIIYPPRRFPSTSSRIGLPVCLLRLPTIHVLAPSSIGSCLPPPLIYGVGVCVPSPAAICNSFRGVLQYLPCPCLTQCILHNVPDYFIQRHDVYLWLILYLQCFIQPLPVLLRPARIPLLLCCRFLTLLGNWGCVFLC